MQKHARPGFVIRASLVGAGIYEYGVRNAFRLPEA